MVLRNGGFFGGFEEWRIFWWFLKNGGFFGGFEEWRVFWWF